LVPAAVLFGLAGAAIAAGAVTGIIHLNDVAALEERCGGSACPPEEQESADTTLPLAHVSTVSFAVGGAALVTGIILAVVRPGGGEPPASARVAVGLGSLEVGGVF
jgi:hypothetical protein